MSQAEQPFSFSTLRQQAGLSVADVAAKAGYAERTVYRWETGEVRPRRAVIEMLQRMKAMSGPSAVPPSFRFIDLFAGIGGLRRGFEQTGGECVFTCERDKYSQQTYRANFPLDQHAIAEDIRNVREEDVPEHDVLLAGFPCQPFSIAGVSKKNALQRPHGFACEAQGTLFYEVARLIACHRPKAFVLENVKNLINHDKGRTFRIIRDVLQKDLGYGVNARIIDGKSWVPQHRERIFIVGFRERNGFTFDNLEVPDPCTGPRLSAILHECDQTLELPYTDRDGLPNPKYTLSDHLWRYLQVYAEKHRMKGNGFGFGLFGPEDIARTLSARYYKDGSEILIRQAGMNPRRLTPRECARLMGFDGPGKLPMRIPVSDTQAYRQFGNSVVVPVVEAVAKHMSPFLTAAMSTAAERARACGSVA